jgi:hypothetical protein
MTSTELDNLVEAGSLKREPPDAAEFEGLRSSGEKRLKDASNSELAPESRFDLAYNAAHALSLAALRWHGYRPDRKRFIVFQALPHTLNLNATIWRILDKAHKIRNAVEYEGTIDVDLNFLEELIAATEAVREKLAVLRVPK